MLASRHGTGLLTTIPMLSRCAASARAALPVASRSLVCPAVAAPAFASRLLHTSPRAMQLSAHHSPNAPAALGPYSQVMVHEATKTAYVSGCIPLDAQTGKLVAGGEGDASAPGVIEKQTEQALANLFAVLKAAGANKESVLKTTVFLKNMEHFKRINAVYEKVRAYFLARTICADTCSRRRLMATSRPARL